MSPGLLEISPGSPVRHFLMWPPFFKQQATSNKQPNNQTSKQPAQQHSTAQSTLTCRTYGPTAASVATQSWSGCSL